MMEIKEMKAWHKIQKTVLIRKKFNQGKQDDENDENVKEESEPGKE